MRYRTLLAASGAALIAALLAANAQVPGVNSTLNSVFTLVYDASTMKPTYSSTATFAPASSATDVCGLTGSATKTIKVRRVMIGGIASTVVTDPVAIIKRSTANVGAGAAMTKVAYDSTNSLTGSTTNTATAVADLWTTNPTVGTAVGLLADIYVTFANPTTGVGVPVVYEFGKLGSPVVLRGVAQSINVNLNGLTYLSAQVTCTFEWTEE